MTENVSHNKSMPDLEYGDGGETTDREMQYMSRNRN
jgi:hypothetical protein